MILSKKFSKRYFSSLKKQFDMLGLSELSSDIEIRERFIFLTKEMHPDNNRPWINYNGVSYISIKEAYHDIIKERRKTRPSDYLLKMIEEDKKLNDLITNLPTSSDEIDNYFKKRSGINIKDVDINHSLHAFNSASLNMIKYSINKNNRKILSTRRQQTRSFQSHSSINNCPITQPERNKYIDKVETDDNNNLRYLYQSICALISIYGFISIFSSTFLPYFYDHNRDTKVAYTNRNYLLNTTNTQIKLIH